MTRPDLTEPPRWRMNHVELAGAINVGPVKPPALTNRLSPLFARARWEVKDHEYATLLPSLHLASHYLEVAIPYLTTFLPADRLYREMQQTKEGIVVEVRKEVTDRDLDAARAEIADIANTTRWQINEDMRANNGWLGVTRTIPKERPWGEITPEDIKKSDDNAKANGAKRRPLIVGIMREYVDALQTNEVTSEIYLRAAFMAAYTIFHEIGHVVYLQDFRAWNVNNVEPWIGDDAWTELGNSIGARVFNGCNPVPADLQNRCWYKFHTHLYWERMNTTKTRPTPWKQISSISVEYIQDCFTDSFWDAFGEVDGKWSEIARAGLNPINAKYPNPAIAMQIQFGTKEEGVDDEVFDNFDETFILSSTSEPPEKVSLVWKKQPYDRTNYGDKRLWYWLTTEDQNFVQGKGPRLIDPTTQAETTGEKDQQQMDEEIRLQIVTYDRMIAQSTIPEPEELQRPKSDLAIAPIVLDQDVEVPHGEMETPKYQRIVQIRVKYRLEKEAEAQESSYASITPGSNKRTMTFSNKVLPTKRTKVHNFTTLSNGPAVQEARRTIENWSIEKMERFLTHHKAFELCQQRNIEFGAYYNNAQWQVEKLDYGKDADKYLMERIRLKFFAVAAKVHASDSFDDVQASLELMVELSNSVVNWGPLAANDFCWEHDIPRDGDAKEVLARVAKVVQKQITELAIKLNGLVRANGAALDMDEREYIKNLKTRYIRTSNDYIDKFIVDKHLPTWGNAKCKRLRAEIFNCFERTGSHPPRETEDRTFDGVETYIFTCNLHSTTVESLMSSLYIEGCFPYTANLALSRQNQHFEAFDKSDKTLADALTWSDEPTIYLQLGVTNSRAPFQSPVDDEPEVYQPRNISPLSGRVIDPSLRRKAAIIAGRAVPTLAERLASLEEVRETLDKAFIADRGKDVLRPHKLAEKTQSGGLILENLKDIDEERDEFLEGLR